jgi:predicted HAD superfamily Cof-like phosphohydrolase
MSDSQLVRDFTKESGTNVPDSPEAMTKQEVHFIIKMVLDEMMELYATVAGPEEAKLAMIKMIAFSKDIPLEFTESKAELIGKQADALVDSYYYSLNCAAKKGTNLSKIFQIVHKANMDKRDPETGKFLRRDDGKIIKPKGWQEPNITEEIKRQIREGAWEETDFHGNIV